MCGQCGLILGQKRRTRKELEALGNMFTELLRHNERRGRDATGIFIADQSGAGKILKAPVSAMYLTESIEYQEAIQSISNKTIALLGHTRFRTVGTPMINENNHPIQTQFCVGTHNGTITNHEELFRIHDWERIGQVDSEAIFRCADNCIHDEKLDMEEFSKKLKEFSGTMSFILYNRREANVVYIGIGNMPLCLQYHAKLRCLCYSSELMPLAMAGKSFKGWKLISNTPMTLLRFDTTDMISRDSVSKPLNIS